MTPPARSGAGPGHRPRPPDRAATWSYTCASLQAGQHRLDAFLAELGPAGLTEAQSRIASLAGQRVAALVRESFSDLDQWQNSRRSLANRLEDLEMRAELVVAKESGVEAKELRIPAGTLPAEALLDAARESETGSACGADVVQASQSETRSRPATPDVHLCGRAGEI